MIMDENACIEKVLLGDAAAYEFLVGKYQSRLVSFLWNLLGCGEDARDAAQEVFIKAYFHLGSFDRLRSFKSWLFAIAYHCAVDMLRKKKQIAPFLAAAGLGGPRTGERSRRRPHRGIPPVAAVFAKNHRPGKGGAGVEVQRRLFCQ